MPLKEHKGGSIDQHLQLKNAKTTKTIQAIVWSSILVLGSCCNKMPYRTRISKKYSSLNLVKML